MKTLRPLLLLTVGTSLLATSCVVAPATRGPHVAVTSGGVHPGVAEVSVGVYDRLPPGHNSPYYHHGDRYYSGGRWEDGRFLHDGRYYEGRYFHGGRYIYGGRYALDSPTPENSYHGGHFIDGGRYAHGPDVRLGLR